MLSIIETKSDKMTRSRNNHTHSIILTTNTSMSAFLSIRVLIFEFIWMLASFFFCFFYTSLDESIRSITSCIIIDLSCSFCFFILLSNLQLLLFRIYQSDQLSHEQSTFCNLLRINEKLHVALSQHRHEQRNK